ncbi:tyrosine-protein phosphatase [Microbacterium pseudoresistens]|uniref:tyrosine-protein phosphatase n=1 Tax=Microbacterium pseudoresistens TaxID=640634 RepID=UPI0031B5896A
MLELPGAVNLRDVGGIPVGDGRIRSGVLFRSGQLAGLTIEGGTMLRARVRRIVDLRDDVEVRHQPSALQGVAITRVPLFLGSVASFFTDDVSLEGMYRGLIEQSAHRLVEVVRVIAAGEPTLVHCTAGKDRTGVSIALALSAVGADRDAVVADYALTETLMPPERRSQIEARVLAQHPEARNAAALATRSPAPIMQALLDEIDRNHGSAAQYLLDAGLSAAELRELTAALVD